MIVCSYLLSQGWDQSSTWLWICIFLLTWIPSYYFCLHPFWRVLIPATSVSGSAGYEVGFIFILWLTRVWNALPQAYWRRERKWAAKGRTSTPTYYSLISVLPHSARPGAGVWRRHWCSSSVYVWISHDCLQNIAGSSRSFGVISTHQDDRCFLGGRRLPGSQAPGFYSLQSEWEDLCRISAPSTWTLRSTRETGESHYRNKTDATNSNTDNNKTADGDTRRRPVGKIFKGMLLSKLNSLAHISTVDMPAKIQLQVHQG